tara:strand:- start:64 stop:840 length:777 start_codon:yes stop_codon:yes gene_type:complete
MKKEATVIIQARMGSERLPGKVLKKIKKDWIALELLVQRLKNSASINNIIIATTNQYEDDEIVNFCIDKKIQYFRGPEDDVVERFKLTANYFQASDIVRISGDCPFTDWGMLDKLVNLYFEHNADFVTNMYKKTFPLGFAIEVFKLEKLLEFKNLDKNEKEHVTTRFINNSESYRFLSIEKSNNLSEYRMTLDTEEDYQVIKKIAESFTDINFTFEDIENLIYSKPNFLNINREIQQKSNYQKNESGKVRSIIYEEIS